LKRTTALSTIAVFSIAAASFLLFSRCNKPGCVGKAGAVTTQIRDLASFHQLTIADNVNVTLIQGETEKVEITGADNILSNITTDISANVLSIANNTGCRWMRDASEKINVRLYFKNLDRIDYHGSGLINNMDTLRLPSLHIESVNGAGEVNLILDNNYTGVYVRLENASIILHGRSETCFTYTNNRGITDLRDFVVKKMTIDYSGVKDTYVNVTDEITAVIFHTGNIIYKGNPFIARAEYRSSGKLVKIP
jgi:hypothetical protein